MINLKGSFESARFEAELVPHRSLTPGGVKLALAVSAATTLPPAIAFGIMGFWPVTVMMLLAQGGLHMGFRASARDSRERQHLVMDQNGLTVTHTRPDWDTPAYYDIPVPSLARIETQDIRGQKKLTLRLHKKEMPLGHFLPPEEAKELQQNLKLALRNWTKEPGITI